MPAPTLSLAPHHSHQSTSIRKVYIQNLTDLLHICLTRGDVVRAKRAWSILVSDPCLSNNRVSLMAQIRCREVDWRSRWQWGLLCLNASTSTETQLTSTFQSEWYDGRVAEKWLRSVRVSAREAEVCASFRLLGMEMGLIVQKPSLLHALVLHLIKHDRHRAALDELDT